MILSDSLGGPLAGIRVLDFCHFLAGPYATMALAEMGADVIKVEDLDHLDSARNLGPHFIGEQSLYFASLNWGKRSVAMKFADPKSRQVVLDLVRSADVVLDNYRPGVMTKLGLDYDSLVEVRPDIISCSLSGFGATGPSARGVAYDYTIQALSGVMSLTGDPDRPPGKAGISYVDHSAGLAAAFAVCAALVERANTGRGRYIDVSLLDVQMSMLTYLASWQLNAGAEPQRTEGGAHPTLVPAQLFATSDGYISVFVGNDPMWARLVLVLEEPRLASEDYATNDQRLARREEVLGLLQYCFARQTSADWTQLLTKQQVPCASVNSVGEALKNEQVRARKLVTRSEHPRYGSYEHVSGPVPSMRASDTDRGAPLVGEHTAEVLGEMGYDKKDVDLLAAQSVVVVQ